MNTKQSDLYRFSLAVIDDNAQVIEYISIDEHVSSLEFTKRNLIGINQSFVVEYIFSKAKFKNSVKFPLTKYNEPAV